MLLLQRCAKFLQFLSMQSGGNSQNSSCAAPPPSTQQLQRHMETLTSHYIALEEYFVCRRAGHHHSIFITAPQALTICMYSQVVKAIRRAHPERPDALPQLADDAMFIVTRSCTRALSTQLPHAVSATVIIKPHTLISIRVLQCEIQSPTSSFLHLQVNNAASALAGEFKATLEVLLNNDVAV